MEAPLENKKKRANKVKVGMNPCLLSGFFPLPLQLLSELGEPWLVADPAGQGRAPGAALGLRWDQCQPLQPRGEGPGSSQDF